MADYPDHNATSTMHPVVVNAMSPFLHKGVGATVVNRKPEHFLISGGYQEIRRRGGTENVARIVGLGRAAQQIAGLEMEHKRHQLEQPIDVLESTLATNQGRVVSGQRAPLGLVNKLPAVIRQAAG